MLQNFIIKVYTTAPNSLVVLVIIYSVEVSTLTNNDERILDIFNRKVLGTIYATVCVDGEWRTYYNHDI